MLRAPEIEEHGGILVVRDDRLAGGTKVRALPRLLTPGREYVYAGPAYGYAQVALAIACRSAGASATAFVARRSVLHPRTAAALAAGAKVVQVPNGYLSNVRAKARAYAAAVGAVALPFGLDCEEMIAGLADAARTLAFCPAEVWTVAGSGVLSRALQRAWPGADFHAVVVGAVPSAGRARLWQAPERFEQDARLPPPFASCSNYDAKAWQFIRRHASPGALFWNVAA